MTPTVINIEGHATLNHIAERAALTLDISDQSHSQSVTSNQVLMTLNDIQTTIEKSCTRLENGNISPEAPVSWYSTESLSTSSEDEYIDDKRTGKTIYSARTSIEIRFRDFAKLGEMVAYFSTMAFVSIRAVEWKLTNEKQAELEEQARFAALRHAIKRAKGYASIIGRENVTPIKIEDDRNVYSSGMRKQLGRRAMTASSEVGVGIDFEPQLIEVKASLEVQFHAE
jgi:uncharacterized protein YggE